jgi:hypothetical protein
MADDIDKVMERIRKLLRVSEGKANEHESTVALQLAQQMADAHNIDIAGVKGSKAGERDDSLFPGGLYQYQRSLYEAIALLNHCLYWSRKGLQKGEKYKHRLVGSKVNVLLTRQMAEYLQSTIERITREEYCGGDPIRYFKKDAHYFREGMVDRIVDKIREKRREQEAEDRRRKAEESARANHPGSTANALVTIDDVSQREAEANYDFLYGEGAWAKQQAARAEREARAKAAAEAYEQWKKANPEEYARQQAELAAQNAEYWKREERNAKRRKGRLTSYKPTKYDSGAYWDGNDRGASVGLDRQVDGGSKGYLK